MNFVGRKIIIRYESGLEVKAHYKSATELTWEALTRPKGRAALRRFIHQRLRQTSSSSVGWRIAGSA
jgi:hypothetical protein